MLYSCCEHCDRSNANHDGYHTPSAATGDAMSEIEARWAIASWAVRVAIPVWGLSTVVGGVDDLLDLPRLTPGTASTDGLDALRAVQYLPEPIFGHLPAARYSEVEIALNQTGFGKRAFAIVSGGGIPYLIWARCLVMCRLYALEQAETFSYPDNWEGWNAWLSGSVSTSNLLGNISPSMEALKWQG